MIRSGARWCLLFAFIGLLVACGSGSSNNPVVDEQTRFLIDNAARDGVFVTESGLQYEILRASTGATPVADSFVTVDYLGTLIDGTQFDSSYQRGVPATFAVQGVIAGWTEALQLMTVGSQYRLVIPPELAYGERGSGSLIQPGAVLIFEVELLEVNSG